MSNKSSIVEMQSIAKDREGYCISGVYFNNRTKLTWKCKNGHIWRNTLAHVKAGQWCRICAGYAFLTINDMINKAHKKEGKWLSKEYNGSHVKLLWECKKKASIFENTS